LLYFLVGYLIASTSASGLGGLKSTTEPYNIAMARSLPSTQSLFQLSPWIAFILSLAVIYFAREVFIPVALATLLTFLLAPVVDCFERWRLARFPAVLIVLVLSLSLVIGTSWVVSKQLLDVINQLPSYKENIHRKLETVHGPKGGVLTQTADSVEQLTKELATTPASQVVPLPREPAKTSKPASPLSLGSRPVAVEVVSPPPNALQSLRDVLGPMVKPLGAAIMVIVFAIFMLMKREDLRNRFIRLVAKGQLNVMTEAMDDAGRRVSRYLLMQGLVNAAFGGLVATGLFFIGVPSAMLWGALAAALRFFPYVGPLIAGTFPFLLALSVFTDWSRPLLTLGLFVGMELVTANVIEPRLYGAHTGISSLAILIAAVFWTLLWGPVGLVLSTPLTVCLLVLGRYVPQLEFLHILLGDEPVLPPEAHFYQRLLAMDQKEAQTVSEVFLKERTLVDLYDEVIIPALAMAEQDRHQGLLKPTNEAFIIQSINELVVELASYSREPPINGHVTDALPGSTNSATGTRSCRIFCLPANDQADEITAAMLAQVLEQSGYPTVSVSDSSQILEEISGQPGDIVCICALPPFAVLHARTLSKRLRRRLPEVKIIVGVWSVPEGGARAHERLEKAVGDKVVTTLKLALEELKQSEELSLLS
jgi:predicted PurR-regulated permease PerM/CheY-like chemotaxis protein